MMSNQHIQYLNHIPEGNEPIDLDLYSRAEYLNNSSCDRIDYCAFDTKKKAVTTSISFHLLSDKAVSLANAPFGGFSIMDKYDADIINKLLAFILDDLSVKKHKSIIIKLAAAYYIEEYYPQILASLSLFGFKKTANDINHHIEVSDVSLEAKMSSMEKRKLKKCIASDFKFTKEPASKLTSIYDFIAKCRSEKNQSLSMSLAHMKAAVQASPDAYVLFSIMDKEKIIAASICVAVNQKVLYNFYPASTTIYKSHSPMVFLLSCIYQYCMENRFSYLDLGTSMLGDSPNSNLMQFKKNMGGIQSEKLSLELV